VTAHSARKGASGFAMAERMGLCSAVGACPKYVYVIAVFARIEKATLVVLRS
jgi:hypothetical protein